MATDVTTELSALRHMTPHQLRDKYLEVFGEVSRTGNKDFLFKRIAWRIQSLSEGSLSERAKARAAELARDADIRMTMPRPGRRRRRWSWWLRGLHRSSGSVRSWRSPL